MLVTLYKIPKFNSVDEFLQNVAIVRGKLKKGGIVDVDAAARIVLHDWNEGKHSLKFVEIHSPNNQKTISNWNLV